MHQSSLQQKKRWNQRPMADDEKFHWLKWMINKTIWSVKANLNLFRNLHSPNDGKHLPLPFRMLK